MVYVGFLGTVPHIPGGTVGQDGYMQKNLGICTVCIGFSGTVLPIPDGAIGWDGQMGFEVHAQCTGFPGTVHPIPVSLIYSEVL